MNKQQHINRHRELHKYLDELVADWMDEADGRPSNTSVMELMIWSHAQTIDPSDQRGSYLDVCEDLKLLHVTYGCDAIGLVALDMQLLLAASDSNLSVPSDIPRVSIDDARMTELYGDEHNWEDLMRHLKQYYDWSAKSLNDAGAERRNNDGH